MQNKAPAKTRASNSKPILPKNAMKMPQSPVRAFSELCFGAAVSSKTPRAQDFIVLLENQHRTSSINTNPTTTPPKKEGTAQLYSTRVATQFLSGLDQREPIQAGSVALQV